MTKILLIMILLPVISFADDSVRRTIRWCDEYNVGDIIQIVDRDIVVIQGYPRNSILQVAQVISTCDYVVKIFNDEGKFLGYGSYTSDHAISKKDIPEIQKILKDLK